MIKTCNKCKKEYEMHDGSSTCPICCERTIISTSENNPTVWKAAPKLKPTAWQDASKPKPTIWKNVPKAPPTKWTEE